MTKVRVRTITMRRNIKEITKLKSVLLYADYVCFAFLFKSYDRVFRVPSFVFIEAGPFDSFECDCGLGP